MAVFNVRLLFQWLLCYNILVQKGWALNHGRNAKPGEFPYVARIIISEEAIAITDDHSETTPDAGRIATAVLITTKRVLTTCDAVGFFAGKTVNMHNLTRVTIMAGSILKSGKGGQFRNPVKSSVHPFCYSLVTGIVLFNYGIYILKHAFVPNNYLSPVHNSYKTGREMDMALRTMYRGEVDINCASAGWGYPRKEFEGKGMPDYFDASSKILQATDMKVVQYEPCYEKTCSNFGDCLLSIWEYGFVCAQAIEGGPCMNDKGAPLVCAGQVYGIHTNPLKCEDAGLPRHFMRVDLAFDYIYDTKNGTIRTFFKNSILALFLMQAILYSFLRQV